MRPAEVTARMLAARRMVGAAKRPRKRLPRQLEPKGVIREYALRLLARVDRAKAALAPLMAELPRLVESARAARADRRLDAGEGRRVRELIDAAKRAIETEERELENIADEFARRTSSWQRIQMQRQTHAALGADVFLNDSKLGALTEGFVAENVALIKSLPTKYYDQIENDVSRALASATPHHKLAAELEHRYKLTRDRARLIARDQVGKLYGQINAARQKALGVTRFTWRTVNDNRVRDEHEEREGQVYEYAKPPRNERTGVPELPGEPILCRCTAEPVFDDVLAILDDL